MSIWYITPWRRVKIYSVKPACTALRSLVQNSCWEDRLAFISDMVLHQRMREWIHPGRARGPDEWGSLLPRTAAWRYWLLSWDSLLIFTPKGCLSLKGLRTFTVMVQDGHSIVNTPILDPLNHAAVQFLSSDQHLSICQCEIFVNSMKILLLKV